MPTDELEEWLRTKANRSPLARSLSALEGFVAAVVAGPVSMDPPTWICPALGVERDAFNHGGTPEFGAICATAVLHNRISDTLTEEPEHFKPRFVIKANGGVDPRPWCQGFHSAMGLNSKLWKPLLNRGHQHHGLVLPILICCQDAKGLPIVATLRPGPETAAFIEHEAHQHIAPAIVAMRKYFHELRYGKLYPSGGFG